MSNFFKNLFRKNEKKIESKENSNKIKAILERAQKTANNRKKIIRNIRNKKINEAVKKYHETITNQKNATNEKMNINKNYILTKLDSTNYNLLYRLINSLFDPKLSNESRETFDIYFKEQKPDKKEEIMKILKAVYRLKLNKSIKNKKQEINNKLKTIKTQENRNQFLAKIKDISSHIDLATGFYNFTGIEYYICNRKQVERNNKKISETEISEIVKLSPIFYANGIFCINPMIRDYTSNKEVMEEDVDELKNINGSNGIKLVKTKVGKNNYNNSNIVNINECIKNIEKFNTKDSFLSKFFEQKILGMATEYGIKNEDRRNTEYINTRNFDRLCSQFNNIIDTIVIVKNNEIVQTHTTETNKKEKPGILLEYFQNKMSGGGHIQVGGFEPLTLIFLVFVICFFLALYNCNKKNEKGLITQNMLSKCIRWNTLNYIIMSVIDVFIDIFTIIFGKRKEMKEFVYNKILFRIEGDITNQRYSKINEIINVKYDNNKGKTNNVTLRNLKLSARNLYKNTNKLKEINNKNKNNNQTKKDAFKKSIYNEIYKNAKSKKTEKKNIISNLINKLPQRYSKLYNNKNWPEQNNKKISQFKKYVKTSIKPGNDINKIIKSYNKNKELTEKNKKTILTYIASKYYTFNN
jgi:hypothetical protein